MPNHGYCKNCWWWKSLHVAMPLDDDETGQCYMHSVGGHKDGECVCHHHGKYWSVKEWSEALSEGIKVAVKILKED